MAISSPSKKLLAVVHVGLLSGVVQTRQQEPLNNEYELHGAALDVCRQIMTETLTSSMTEQYQIMVTQDAVDVDSGKGFESLTLVSASPCCTVSMLYSLVFRFDLNVLYFMLYLIVTMFYFSFFQFRFPAEFVSASRPRKQA